ncbi:barstar family protein [Noviherbaspirillum sp.]|uniref:barstar family protein n=1 Tax=Noviherbaspirillum sp. TaxID=1926288 RepID=UPI002FE2C1EF
MRIESLQREPAKLFAPAEDDMDLFKTVPPNVVQSIRAFRVADLQDEAARLGQHFLYAYCADAATKQQVLACIAEAFHFPKHFGKNFDLLRDCLTNLAHKSGPQPGFLVVLEQLPNTAKFDKEARETLLDVFRDAAEFWADKKVAFRVFYSFQ